jgi:hypothetical protein
LLRCGFDLPHSGHEVFALPFLLTPLLLKDAEQDLEQNFLLVVS